MDGRGAFLAIKDQAEGKAALATTKTKAYASIRYAHYKGDRKHFGFQNYVQIHQDAHSDLELLRESIPETKKVDDFLVGIIDPRLQNRKDNCIGDDMKMADFQLCQALLTSRVYKALAQDRLQRIVSYTSTENRGGGRG
jgi:predicted TIM-barrel fold metal-dependent hydrolase